MYPQAFFQLQIAFARKVAAITSLSLSDSLLRYTALARIIGLGWQVADDDAVWGEFVSLAIQGDDHAYGFYAQRFPQIPRFEDQPHWGCFAYEYSPERALVRIHFGASDGSTYGPLSTLRLPIRMADLRSMFSHIRQHAPLATAVRGGSWLYNRREYQRLFPEQYVASAQPIAPHYRARALWGQFLRSNGEMNSEVADTFQQRVPLIHTVEDIPRCFPYPVLETTAPIALFYEFYGICILDT